MLVINSIAELKQWRAQQNNLALVPTMGYLHEGHLSLIREARNLADKVVVSIFVNPLQFNANEDLSRYPRNIENDLKLCEESGADVVFIPEAAEIYAKGYPPKTLIRVQHMEDHLCGAKRHGHFGGVCTVVAKLFNIVTPDMALFGRKDIQQLRIIETMVDELNFAVKIIGCDTVRAADGLALSSRNSYLSTAERQQALVVPQLLQHIRSLVDNGEINVTKLIRAGKSFVSSCPVASLDYLEIVDYTSLQPVQTIQDKTIIATAIFIGKTRLIDNIVLSGPAGKNNAAT